MVKLCRSKFNLQLAIYLQDTDQRMGMALYQNSFHRDLGIDI